MKKFFKGRIFSLPPPVKEAERFKGVNRMSIDKLRKVDIAEDTGVMGYYQNLKRYCRFLTQSSWDGDDLLQEVTAKAIRHYQPSQISSALLKKMAYHHWIDTVRKRSREITGIPEDFHHSRKAM